MSFSLRRAQSSRFLINPFGDHRALLVSSEPLGLELVAERLNVEDSAPDSYRDCGFILFLNFS